MRFWVQYHNLDKLGYLPGSNQWNGQTDLAELNTAEFDMNCTSTTKKDILDALGDIAFMIVGYGSSPKRYVLWSWHVIEDLEPDEAGNYDASGPGKVLNPPQLLSGDDFSEFRRFVGNFGLGFQNVTSSSYTEVLLNMAADDDESILSYLETPLAETYEQALEFIDEEGGFNPVTSEEELLDRIYREVAYRHGQPDFRRRLLHAYGNRCAISGTALIGVLEAAHIIPVAEQAFFAVQNGLLLRSDIHNLFDLGLLRIDPESYVVRVTLELRGSEYEQFEGQRIHLPESESDYPHVEALRRRWKMYPELL